MQYRSVVVSQLLQAWKSQPVFVSILGGSAAGDVSCAVAIPSMAITAAGARSASSGYMKIHTSSTINSNSAVASGGGGGAPKPGSDSPSLWSLLRRTLFPIGSTNSAPSTAGSSSTSTSSPGAAASVTASITRFRGDGAHSPAGAAAALAASREARVAQRRSSRVKEDAFTDLSKNAERFSATLLKAAVMLITIPLAVHMLSHSLMTSLCIRGLEADRPETVALTLRRIRSVVVSEYLATKFEQEDGVGLLMAVLAQGVNEDVLREALATAQHLMRFRSTREGMLMSSLVDKLERALATGWLPEGELREAARQLYLDAHAALRMEVEAGHSGGSSPHSGRPAAA